MNETGPAVKAEREAQCKQARPHKELIAELLDSRRLKTEREHAAAAEIENLYGLLEAARAHNQNLKQAWQAKVDALGLAITNACYPWTPEMRTAYEMLPVVKVGAADTAVVTREMIGAAHDVMLAKGDFVLSAALLERIYLAMDAKRHNARVQAAAEGGRAWNDVLGTDVTGGTDGCDGNY